ncbi:MAG TPA: hypothetical protein VN699_21325 [Pirellulales bacterium]|nr:hypothetical protein [Pirellulales bacterium]
MDQKKPRSPLFWIAIAVPVGFVSLCCLGSCIVGMVGVQVEDREKQTSGAAPQVEPASGAASVAEPAPTREAPPFEEIRTNAKEMTDAQWNKYGPSLAGSHVAWSGWVKEVNEKTFGGYEVWIDMDAPDVPLSVQDVYADIPDDLALQLRKGQQVRVSGTIKSATNLLGSMAIRLEKGATVTP